jgi:hypothetical protein
LNATKSILFPIIACFYSFICNAQKLHKEVISSAFSSNEFQTIGLSLVPIQQSTSIHFYGFEEPFYKNTFLTDAFLNIKIHPNPFVEIFTIESTEEILNYELKLFTIGGSIIEGSVIPTKKELLVAVKSHYQGFIIVSARINQKHHLKKVIKK